MKARIATSIWLAFTLAGCNDSLDDASSADESVLTDTQAQKRDSQTLSLCSGDPATLTGVVEAVGVPGEGLTIATADGSVTVFGLGPIWYWTQNGVARPVVGDSAVIVITDLITGVEDVLMSITVNGVELPLRAAATCVPLWRGAGSRG